MNDTVAVIIPTYNRVALLGRALESVTTQSRQADEVCVVDDGSIDGTEELVKDHYPDTIYIKQENSGVSSARNKGVEATTSQYLSFLDSDDEWLPKKLETQMSALQAEPDFRLVHSDEIWVRNGKRVNQMDKHRKRGGELFARCLPLCVISPSSVVLERSLYVELGGFDESLPACEDYDLWLRLCSREQVLFIDTPLLKKYGGHEDQLSRQYWGMDRFRVQSLVKLLNTGVLKDEQERLAKITLLEKVEILRNGAAKRGKTESAEYYEQLLINFSEVASES
ncbi:MAG: glycosyl transferase [SAR86 cluster bacterium]|uniref:Glycosyl transferase n=1 Tax=SAR86 cluster bacterium TaxID=2030880 RepID=A0A2A4X5F0_9GAMM|nr:MAG: glycosyl transferase [SAR86 cluster bacterium]